MIKILNCRHSTEEGHTYDIKGITNWKDGYHCVGRRRRSSAAAFSGYGLIPTGDVTMVKYAPMGASGGASYTQLWS